MGACPLGALFILTVLSLAPSPLTLQDNIQQFLYRCQDLGLNDAQLFDTMDLQETRTVRKAG